MTQMADLLSTYTTQSQMSSFFIDKMGIYSVKSYDATGDGATDDTVEIQATITAAIAAGGGIVFFPTGDYKITAALSISGNVICLGVGISSTTIHAYGCNCFNLSGNDVYFESMQLFSYSSLGVVDPVTYTGISSDGVSGTALYRINMKNLYLRGWQYCINFAYTWDSVIDNVQTINCLTSLRTFGQSVNNSVTNSRFVTDGTASSRCIILAKDGATVGEGLMIDNTLIASGNDGIYSDGFLSLNIDNCIIDLIQDRAFDLTSVIGLCLSNSWVYSTGDAIVSNDVSVLENQSCKVIGCTITSVSGTNGILIGSNVVGWKFIGNDITTNDYCMYFQTTTQRCTVIGNKFTSVTNAVYPIFLSGTLHNISNNTGNCAVQVYTTNGRNTVFNNEGAGGTQLQGAYNVAPIDGTWKRGDIIWCNQPIAGSPVGLVCTVAGTPGTWSRIWAYDQQSANPDTSGVILSDLEIEVNQLKAALRAVGILAT